MPPWMIKQGMILSKEQRGEVKEVYGNSVPGGSDDKKSNVEENAQAIVVRTLQRGSIYDHDEGFEQSLTPLGLDFLVG